MHIKFTFYDENLSRKKKVHKNIIFVLFFFPQSINSGKFIYVSYFICYYAANGTPIFLLIYFFLFKELLGIIFRINVNVVIVIYLLFTFALNLME